MHWLARDAGGLVAAMVEPLTYLSVADGRSLSLLLVDGRVAMPSPASRCDWVNW
jgi:hypothetical protein